MNTTRSLVPAVQAFADTLTSSWVFGNIVRLDSTNAIVGEIEHNGASAELRISPAPEGIQIELGTYRSNSDFCPTMLVSHLTRAVEVLHSGVKVNA